MKLALTTNTSQLQSKE